jgi:hypothetical protein
MEFWVTKTSENAQVIVIWILTKEPKVRCMKENGAGWTNVKKMGGGVEGLMRADTHLVGNPKRKV